MVELAIKFDFPVSNNQVEYEALIVGLQLAFDITATRLTICNESQIMKSQVIGAYQAKDTLLQNYLAKVKHLMKKFDSYEVYHVLREENVRADILSKLASTKSGGNNKSLIQESLKTFSIAEAVPTLTIEEYPSLMTSIIQYLKNGTLPDDIVEAKRMANEASYYIIIGGQLYRRSLSQPLLKCLRTARISFILEEIHEGSCGLYLEGKALALNVLRAGYYWPSMTKDSIDFIKKCLKC